jgi:hypothetical protein
VDLLGTPLLLLCIALTVAAPAGAVLLWARVRGWPPFKLPSASGSSWSAS